MTPTLRKGQRLRPVHPALAEREWGVRGDAIGAVMCSYRVLTDPEGAGRVDVRFLRCGRLGAPASEFEVIGEGPERH